MATLSTSSLPNTDNGSLILTLDTSKSYGGPTNALTFRPRSSAQGGAVMSVPQRFRLDIVGMADNEGHAFDSYLTSLLNVLVQPEGEELIALCASGATYQFAVGASSESRSGKGKYHSIGAETRRVSKAVSVSAYYETFEAVTARVRALVASARARAATSGPFIGPSTNQDYRCKLEDALVRLFQNADEQSAMLYTSGLLSRFAVAAIDQVEVASDGSLAVQWNSSFLTTLDPTSYGDNAICLFTVLVEYCKNDPQQWSMTVDGMRIGARSQVSALSVLLGGTDVRFSLPGGTIYTVPSNEVQRVVRPQSGTDYTPVDDLGRATAAEGPRYIDVQALPTPTDKRPGQCAQLEDNSNPLTLAMELGILSQVRSDSDLSASLLDLTASDKQLKKAYGTEKVTAGLVDQSENSLSERRVPIVRVDTLRNIVIDRARAAENLIRKALPSLTDDTPLPVDEKGNRVLVLYSLTPTLEEALRQAMVPLTSIENFVGGTCRDSFLDSVRGPVLRIPAVVSALRNTLQQVQFGGALVQPQAWAELVKEERTHCVQRYREMVKNGSGDPEAGGEEPSSYGWIVAIAAIPLLGILLAACASSSSRKEIKEPVAQIPYRIVDLSSYPLAEPASSEAVKPL